MVTKATTKNRAKRIRKPKVAKAVAEPELKRMELPITVMIPVGPYEHNKQWLGEAIDSIWGQTMLPSEILLIDDMAHLEQVDVGDDVHIWKPPWHIGVACAWNFGVALAENDLVFIMASDDRIEPWCLESCWKAWKDNGEDPLGYYWCDIQFSAEADHIQKVVSGSAMIHKELCRITGGMPLEGVVGAHDAAFVDILREHNLATFYHVEAEKAPAWHRDYNHPKQVNRESWHLVMGQMRELVVKEWKPPIWT